MDGQNPRTNGKSKAIQRKLHKAAYTYTQKEKKEKYTYISIYKKKEQSNQINKHIYQ